MILDPVVPPFHGSGAIFAPFGAVLILAVDFLTTGAGDCAVTVGAFTGADTDGADPAPIDVPRISDIPALKTFLTTCPGPTPGLPIPVLC